MVRFVTGIMSEQKVEICLRLADSAWSFLVVLPVCVFYWSGTWKLADHYLSLTQEKDELLTYYLSLAIGLSFGLSGYFILPVLGRCILPQNSTLHLCVSRIFIYLFAFGTVNYWRGIWMITDHFLGYETKWSGIAYVIVTFSLILLRSSTSAIGSPFVLGRDDNLQFYKVNVHGFSHPQVGVLGICFNLCLALIRF